MIDIKPTEFKSKRLRQRLEAMRSETVIVPDWKRIGMRAVPITVLSGVWLLLTFDLIVIPKLVGGVALAVAAFLGGMSFLYITDQRLWVEWHGRDARER